MGNGSTSLKKRLSHSRENRENMTINKMSDDILIIFKGDNKIAIMWENVPILRGCMLKNLGVKCRSHNSHSSNLITHIHTHQVHTKAARRKTHQNVNTCQPYMEGK